MLKRGGCEGRGRDEFITTENVGGGCCGWGRNWRDGTGGRLLMGGRGKVLIETSWAIPTHGGANRADFSKVSPGQRGAGEVYPLGTGEAL